MLTKSGRLVLSALSIPVSFAAVEVAFSMYKNLLKDDRKSLKPDTVEKWQILYYCTIVQKKTLQISLDVFDNG